MTTVIATTSALGPPSLDSTSTSRPYPPIAPIATSSATATATATTPAATPTSKTYTPPYNPSPTHRRTPPDGANCSPIPTECVLQFRALIEAGRSLIHLTRTRLAQHRKIVVKKEPPSPEMDISTLRHRPRRLDLSKAPESQPSSNGLTSAGLRTSKQSAGLAVHDMGIACISPGFQTQDPGMREQLQRSLNVREQQRQLIEARQKGSTSANTSAPADHADGSGALFRSIETPATSRRKGPPPGLSIQTPSHEIFARERVIQSAPLNQTFTGLHRNVHPMTRHIANQPSSLSSTSHVHHVPATNTNNRLPPIADVFAGSSFPTTSQSSRAAVFPHSNSTGRTSSPGHSSQSNIQPPLQSPGLPPPHHQQRSPFPPHSSHGPAPQPRPREYRSAEDAMHGLSGGRDDLLPRIVHYGGHQPPTPSSPVPHHKGITSHAGPPPSSGRRRDREEFERDMSPPPQVRRRTGDGLLGRDEREAGWLEGRWQKDSPETRERKKDEFLALCSRAWDLLQS